MFAAASFASTSSMHLNPPTISFPHPRLTPACWVIFGERKWVNSRERQRALKLLGDGAGSDPWAATIYAALVLEEEGVLSPKALQHLRSAARAGHAAARLALALNWPDGALDERDSWIDEAVGAGNPRAMTVAADRSAEQDPDKAKLLLDRACDLGDEAGCWARAQMELQAAEGKETSRYLELVRRAAEMPGLYSATALRRTIRKATRDDSIPSSAGVVALSAAATAVNRGDQLTGKRWLQIAQGLEPATRRAAEDFESLLDISNATTSDQKRVGDVPKSVERVS